MAAEICVAATCHLLPKDIEITHIKSRAETSSDIFFGSVTSPSIYEFLLNIGVSEPEILLGTQTAFSLGTHYKNWGSDKRDWIQSFYAPLPLFEGVGFHHYLKRRQKQTAESLPLEDYIMSAHAARKNVFAHPPEGKNIPLATVEYGYHFSPNDWRRFFAERNKAGRVKIVENDISKIDIIKNKISAVHLNAEQKIDADLFIDCSSDGALISKVSNEDLNSQEQVAAFAGFSASREFNSTCRSLTGADYGWHSETPLRDGVYHLTVYRTEDRDKAIAARNSNELTESQRTLFKREKPWIGNCIAISQAAATIDPLTPAPIMMLQNDIERIMELLPVTGDMTVEQREYTRRFSDNYDHAALFTQAFFQTFEPTQSPYFSQKLSSFKDKRLETKITQFENRGLLVQYDHELFRAEDWTMLHIGIGRIPNRYDPLADKLPSQLIEQKLEQIKKANTVMAIKMPPIQIYMTSLLKYLRKKQNVS